MKEDYGYYYEYSEFSDIEDFNVNVADTTNWRGLDLEINPPDWFTPISNFLDSINKQVRTFLDTIIAVLDIIKPIYETINLVKNPIYSMLLQLKKLILDVLEDIGNAGGFLLIILPEDKVTKQIKLDFWDVIGSKAVTKSVKDKDGNLKLTEKVSKEAEPIIKKYKLAEEFINAFSDYAQISNPDDAAYKEIYEQSLREKKEALNQLLELHKQNKLYEYDNIYYIKPPADLSTNYIRRKLYEAFNEDTDNVYRKYCIPNFSDDDYVGGFGFMIGTPSISEWLRYFSAFANFFDIFKGMDLLPKSELPNLRIEANKFIPEFKIVWDYIPSKEQDPNKGCHLFVIDVTRTSEVTGDIVNFRIVETAETNRITSFIDCGGYIILENVDISKTYVKTHNEKNNFDTDRMTNRGVTLNYSEKDTSPTATKTMYKRAAFDLYGTFAYRTADHKINHYEKDQFNNWKKNYDYILVTEPMFGGNKYKLIPNTVYNYKIQIYLNKEGYVTKEAKIAEKNYKETYDSLVEAESKLKFAKMKIGGTFSFTPPSKKKLKEEADLEQEIDFLEAKVDGLRKTLDYQQTIIDNLKKSNKYFGTSDKYKLYEEAVLVYNDTLSAKTPIALDLFVSLNGTWENSFEHGIRIENGVWNGVSINTLFPILQKFKDYCEEVADLIISWYKVGDDIIDEFFKTLEKWKDEIVKYINGFNFTLNQFLFNFKVVIKGFYYKYLALGKGGNNRYLREMLSGMPQYSPDAYVGAIFIMYGSTNFDKAKKQWKFIEDLFNSSFSPTNIENNFKNIWNNYTNKVKDNWDATVKANKELMEKNHSKS